MIEKTINYEGNEYRRIKTITGKLHTYVEYRNREIGRIKFFQIENGKRKEITDKEDLRYAIEKNYILNDNI